MVKRVAIIPARGGSKRIPKKNIIDFCGKPMIAWTIEAALATRLFDHVLVSTDCENIARVAKRYGAKVPFLRAEANDDITPVSQATIVALSQLSEFTKESFDVVVQLMPNCPIRDAETITKSIKNFDANPNNFQISTFKYGWMNPWWAMRVDDATGRPEFIFPHGIKSRSQDLPELQCPTGAIWIAKVDKLIEVGSFYGLDLRTYLIPWQQALDIDDYEDLDMAKVVQTLMSKEPRI